ncbi:MAG: hypothetical protein ACMXYK_04745 [Candidatus Woesearchaeota archaeon]
MKEKHWTEQYFFLELLAFVIGITFLVYGQSLAYVVYTYAGAGFIVFGMLRTLFQKQEETKA